MLPNDLVYFTCLGLTLLAATGYAVNVWRGEKDEDDDIMILTILILSSFIPFINTLTAGLSVTGYTFLGLRWLLSQRRGG